MAIEREDVLLPPGPYNLIDRSNRTPDKLSRAPQRKDDYSLHHILPYRYVAFVGFVVEAFRDKYVPEAQRAKWPEDASDERGGRVAEILEVVGKFGPQQAELQTQFAWMGPNLFQGPSGNFRLDDPKSEREPNRPPSLPIARWNTLLDLAILIDAMALLPAQGGCKVTRPITVKDFDALLWKLMPFVGAGRSNAHKFRPDDWICLVSAADAYKPKPDSEVDGAFLERFRHHLRSQPDRVARYKPGKLQVPPGNPVVWRLRLDYENIPDPSFESPQLQPRNSSAG